jgi:hypothetical protein
MHHQRRDCNKIAGSQKACFTCWYSPFLREIWISWKAIFLPLCTRIKYCGYMKWNISLGKATYKWKTVHTWKCGWNWIDILGTNRNMFKFQQEIPSFMLGIYGMYYGGSWLTWTLTFYKKNIHARIAKLSLLLKIFSLYTKTFFPIILARYWCHNRPLPSSLCKIVPSEYSGQDYKAFYIILIDKSNVPFVWTHRLHRKVYLWFIWLWCVNLHFIPLNDWMILNNEQAFGLISRYHPVTCLITIDGFWIYWSLAHLYNS